MALPGTIQSAPPGTLGFDADTVITATVAQQFVQQGYGFCLRYLSLGDGQDANDLSTDEAGDILTAGLALMPVQHVNGAGWHPTASLGQEHGGNAANNALAIGFPPGVNVWCDLEGVNPSSTKQEIIAYCKEWYAAVSAPGFVPGLYVGAQTRLSGRQLYDLPFEHYWKSFSRVPAIPVRGYQMIQTFVEESVNGIRIDQNTTQIDSNGGQALWLVAGS